MAVSWSTKWWWNTGFSADSVEWCPVEGYRRVLVCGTYQLDKNDAEQATKQKRLGRIYLFTIDDTTTDLFPVQTIDTSGVLDQKWCYHTIQNHPVLGVVTSEGSLQLYRLVDNQGFLNLELWIDYSIGQDVLALSLDWSTNKTESEHRIVVSDSLGNVTVFKVGDGGVEKLGMWKSHGFEAWIGAFNYWNGDVFYSGGDDCVFKSYDTRVPETAVMSNRSHEAGVTSVRSHVDVEHQLLTGSYDDRIRLWDARSLKRCITETNVNGGVWRLKWHPYHSSIILAACMYGGFRTLNLDGELRVVNEYMEHESIAYGADWRFDKQLPLVATCSFYDCKLHVSSYEIVL
ncbi:diphthine methyltransferase isoform X1 [Pectinophora gossypiella]|nr:diphthine methyltransferase isoform X1 [Pectinophora gossypiella]